MHQWDYIGYYFCFLSSYWHSHGCFCSSSLIVVSGMVSDTLAVGIAAGLVPTVSSAAVPYVTVPAAVGAADCV